jgi:Ca2+/Na+ antiporter
VAIFPAVAGGLGLGLMINRFWAHIDGMNETFVQIAVVVAVLLIVISYLVNRTDLKRSIVVSLCAALIAMVLLAALRNFGP